MGIKTDGRFCLHCQKNVLAQSNKPNHLLHLVLTILTMGVWGVVWLCLTLLSIGNYRCTQCGQRV